MQLPQLLSLDAYLANETAIDEQLRAGTYAQPIPLLNYAQLQQLPDGTLVRFRGMVQDMLDPEIYLERYEVRTAEGGVRVQDGRYRDILVRKTNETVTFENPNNLNGERRALFLVSVPGLNDWAAQAERDKSAVDLQAGGASAEPGTGTKRSHESDDAEATAEAMDTGAAALSAVPKKSNTASDADGNRPAGGSSAAPPTALLSAEYLLNSPLRDRPGRACLAKVYTDIDDYPLNTLLEVTGFLSVNPVLDASTHPADEDADAADEEALRFDTMAEVQAANPPPSLVPRLHCVHVRRLIHTNPLLPDVDAQLAELEGAAADTLDLFKDLRLALTQCLFGDAVAAEYMMCHLIASVYMRSEMSAVGQMSLNLAGVPASVLPWYTTELYAVLESLVPVSHLLPLTLENLNELQFEPKKDYTTNKVTSGLLQLANHTHLVLDETQLLEGQLLAGGVAAVKSLAHLIQRQTMQVDFRYYELDYNVDVQVLCLSEGKSMLPTDCHVPLRPVDETAVAQIRETMAAVRHFLQPKLSVLRRRLTQLKLTAFDMKQEFTETITADFVEMRRADQNVNEQDLHALLVLSRLMGLCAGNKVLTEEMWQRAKRLEGERKARLAEQTEF